MAEKYPLLPDRKQEVLSTEAARWVDPEGHERAVVVTAEMDRWTVFLSRDDGTWASFERRHERLDTGPTSSLGALKKNWSGQMIVASDPKTLVVGAKREIGGSVGIFLDRFTFDAAGGGQLEPLSSEPVLLTPDELGIDAFGFWIRSAVHKGRLVLVTQAAAKGEAHLVLLLSTATELAALEGSANAWKLERLDAGGFDLDAVQAGDRVEIVHRRVPGYITVPRDETPSPDAAFLIDDPNLDLPQLADMLTPLVRVSVDLSDPASPELDDSLPPLEHPQILDLDPFVIVGDRLLTGELRTMGSDDEAHLRFRSHSAEKAVILRHGETWLSDHLYWRHPNQVPRQLHPLGASQLLLSRSEAHFEIASLMPQDPVALLGPQDEEKRGKIILAHEDHRSRSLVATTFQLAVLSNPVRLHAVNEGFAVLDIGREPIGEEAGILHVEENGQFEPLHAYGPVDHADGFRIAGPQRYKNTMGGAVSAPLERGAELYAYVDMGDAGLRVFYESEVNAPPPLAPHDSKSLPITAVTGPAGQEHAWVELSAVAWTPSQIPTYRAAYADFLRGVQDPETQVIPDSVSTLLLPYLAGSLVRDYSAPKSLQTYLQPTFDLLPLALALSGNWDLNQQGPPLAAPEITLVVEETLELEGYTAQESGSVSESSGNDDAFDLELEQEPSTVYPGIPVTFSAKSTVGDLTYEWTIETGVEDEDDLTESGATVQMTYTQPGTHTVELVASDTSDQAVTLKREVRVAEPLWSTLWSIFDSVSAGGFFSLSKLALELFQYRLEFDTDSGGGRPLVSLRWLDQVRAFHRFAGVGIQQGRIHNQIVLGFETGAVTLTGVLGAAVNVLSVEGSYSYGRAFSPSVLTSDRRSEDPVTRRASDPPTETVRDAEDVPGGTRSRPAAAALALKPVSPTELSVRALDLEIELSPAARSVGWLVTALIALGLGAIAAGALIGAVIAAVVGIAAGVFVGVGLVALAAAAVAIGLGWVLIEVIAPPLLKAAAIAYVRGELEAEIEDLKEELDASDILTYAGEGLAEGLSAQVFEKAQAQGTNVADPEGLGRDRYRHALFETVFVADGVCRVRLRVPPG